MTHAFAVVGHELERRVSFSSAMPLLRLVAADPRAGSEVERALFGSDPKTGPLEPVRVFELVHRALLSMGPALVVVDDVQWIDAMSLALVHHVIRAAHTDRCPLIVFVASRPALAVGELDVALDHILESRFKRIELDPLPRREAALLARHLDPGLTEEEALAVSDRAQGSPFWVEALARASGTAAEPATLVRERARNCSPDASFLLGLLTVWGRPMEREAVAATAGWTRARVDGAAAELAARGLVVEYPDALMLAHDLIREAAASDMSLELITRLHRLVGTWLADRGDGDLVALLEAMTHLRAAGEDVADLALRVATSPRARLLGDAGLEQLVAVASDATTGDEALRLHVAIATVAGDLGARELALHSWTVVADRHRSADRRAEAALAAAELAFDLGRGEEAKAWLSRARRARPDDADHQIRLLAVESVILRWVDHHQADAEALSEQALAEARARVPGSATHMVALRSAYDAAMMAENPSAMLMLADEMLDARRGDDRDVLVAGLRRAMALRHVGRYREAARCLEDLLLEATARVLPVAMLDASFWLALTLRTLGDLEEGERLARQAAGLGARIGNLSSVQMSAPSASHLIALSRGDWRSALVDLESDVLAHTELHHRVLLRAESFIAQARLLGASARPAVCASFEIASEEIDTVGCVRCQGELDIRAPEALARVGVVEPAVAMIDGWERRHPVPDPPAVVWHGRSAGVVAAACGDSARAVEMLESAIAQSDRLDMRFETLWLRLDLGDVLSEVDPHRSDDIYRDAASLAADLGARTELARAEQALRRHGVRTWRRKAAAGPGLTDREREVASLAATGATNPEIAAALFLSRKTVERHITNVLAKLGARNRTQLASVLRDEGEPR
jgi:DNA-binding CsgD family transcriptional regulator